MNDGKEILGRMEFKYDQNDITTMRDESVAIFDKISKIEFEAHFGPSHHIEI